MYPLANHAAINLNNNDYASEPRHDGWEVLVANSLEMKHSGTWNSEFGPVAHIPGDRLISDRRYYPLLNYVVNDRNEDDDIFEPGDEGSLRPLRNYLKGRKQLNPEVRSRNTLLYRRS